MTSLVGLLREAADVLRRIDETKGVAAIRVDFTCHDLLARIDAALIPTRVGPPLSAPKRRKGEKKP